MTPKMLEQVKAQLELEAQLKETSARIPMEKGIVGVVADYLKELVRYTDKAFASTYPASMINQLGDRIAIHYVITVPAVSSLFVCVQCYVGTNSSVYGL